MKDKEIKKNMDKKYNLLRIFIIKDNYFYSTSNTNYENNLENYYCIKNLGSDVEPRIYLDVKMGNKILINNKYIGNLQTLIEFIVENQNNFIVVKGFSRASMANFLQMLNTKKRIKLKPIKFNSRVNQAKFERHLLTKEKRLKELNNKLKSLDRIESSEEYLKTSNSIFGYNRHKSRNKILKLKHQK